MSSSPVRNGHGLQFIVEVHRMTRRHKPTKYLIAFITWSLETPYVTLSLLHYIVVTLVKRTERSEEKQYSSNLARVMSHRL